MIGDIQKLVSIDLPDKPYDEDHIILIACTDAYDYTPLKKMMFLLRMILLI